MSCTAKRCKSYYELIKMFGKRNKSELASLAIILCGELGIKITREEKRVKVLLYKWYDEHWDTIKNRLRYFKFLDSNYKTFVDQYVDVSGNVYPVNVNSYKYKQSIKQSQTDKTHISTLTSTSYSDNIKYENATCESVSYFQEEDNEKYTDLYQNDLQLNQRYDYYDWKYDLNSEYDRSYLI